MATVPLPHLFAVGEVVTADNINTYNSGIAFLENPPLCVMYQAGAQSIPNAALTAVIFDTNEVDTYNGHSLVTNPTRYTSQVAGWYELSGVGSLVSGAGTFRVTTWAKNGTAVPGGSTILPPVSGVGTSIPAVTREVFLALTDYVELQIEQNTGGALNTSVVAGQQSMATIRWVHA